ncbi:hypothetical protein [Clostridium sp. 'White wine YQ']|uniref:hypothetical protein n=1 Tax=Clostridium sp. 'White wine YQ' TaxID=3027474 RepID=UPI002367381D|nr:hypothetical protein [Clostridium sp. 'White wine YQ']MDD7794622.1 hypothetical protein [Clostridium sp. 'White wine YQ']
MNNANIEVLNTAKEYIIPLTRGIEQAVNHFHTGDERNGANLIIQIADGIEWLVNALMISRDLIDSEKNVSELNDKLREIVEAFENEDYILISDLLEYEVKPVLSDIQSNLQGILKS